ncbi:putative ribonuclease H-like domain-containing protein [Tanacetum coccineum]
MELEKVVKERDELNIKIAKWEESSKSLNILLNSQMSAHDKNGLGYGTQLNEMSDKSETDREISMSVFEVRSSDEELTPANDKFSKVNRYHAVPPPITGNFLTSRADISCSETVGNTNEVNVEKPKFVNELVVSTPNINKDKVIIEDWNSDDEDDVSEVSPVKTNETQTAKTQVDKIGQTSKKAGIGFKKIKACFVCKSTDHLIKDCDFYDKKSPEPKLKNVVNTGQRVVKPVWDNAKRVNHQKFSNKLNYPQARRTFVPSGVLTRTGLVNPVRPNEKRAVQTINTARPVSTARSYYTKPAFRPKNLKQDVRTSRVKIMTTAGTCAVLLLGNLRDPVYRIMLLSGGFSGSGPDWMFDLDFLTNTMNYIPVSVENQITVDAGTQESYVAGSSGKDKEPTQEKDFAAKTSLEADLERMVAQEMAAQAVDDATRQAFEEEKRKSASTKRAAQATSINKLNTGRPSVNTANTPYVSAAHTPTGANAGESSFVYLGGQIPIDASTLPNADLPTDLNMPDLEDVSNAFPNDGIFSGAYDDDDVGAEADSNNIDNAIDVSPIPTLRFCKDHPKGQILGDPKSAFQTRGKIQKASSVQQALVSYIYNQNRTNHKDHQNCLFACFLSQEEPKNISQALQDESWVEAMQEELLQFKLQKVWVLVDFPYGKKVIGTKWVFRNKRDKRSIVVKNKARLVAQGFRQEEGIDYDEVFAPVARIEAIRLFLAFASYMGFTVYQMDVKSAFLIWHIGEEVYVQQPSGFVDPAHPTKVYKVIKALYGLHQAPRAWYEKLFSFLLENGSGDRSMIGSLMYLTASRPDIMFAVLTMEEPVLTENQQQVDVNFLVED